MTKLKKQLWLMGTVLASPFVLLTVHPMLLSELSTLSVNSTIRPSAAFLQASSAFQNSPAAKQLLGDSLRMGAPVKGDLRERGSSGHLTFDVPAAGGRAHGLLYGRATRQKNIWRVDELAVRLDGQSEWHELEINDAPTVISLLQSPITAH